MSSLSQIRWHCRRGMLELDLLLNTFVDSYYQKLSDDEREQFTRLLDYPDQTLYEILIGKNKPADERMTQLIQTISKANAEKFHSV